MRARAGWSGGLVIALALWSLLPGGGVRAAAAQGVPVGTAQNAVGTLVVVRTDGIEHRLQGRGSLPLFEGDVLRTEAASQALIQLRPGIPVALNERTSLKILSRWDKTGGTTRILRVSRGGDLGQGGGRREPARGREPRRRRRGARRRDRSEGGRGRSELAHRGAGHRGAGHALRRLHGTRRDRQRGRARRGVHGPAAGERGGGGVLEAGGVAVTVGRSAEDQIERDAEAPQPDHDADEGAGLALDRLAVERRRETRRLVRRISTIPATRMIESTRATESSIRTALAVGRALG